MHLPHITNLGRVLFITLLTTSATVHAGYYSCGSANYATNPRTCPDGSIPFYNSGTMPSATPTLTGIALASNSLSVGATTSISAIPGGASLGSCSSANTSVASINGTVVTAMAAGTTSISCGAYSTPLTVVASSPTVALTGITLGASTIAAGSTTTISPVPSTASLGTCTSDSTAVATVNGSNITAIATGTTNISCSGLSANLTVTANTASNGPLNFSVDSVEFGLVPVTEFHNAPPTVSVTVSANDYYTIMAAPDLVGDASYRLIQNSCTPGYSLIPGGKCRFTLSFAPETTGLKTTTLSLQTETINTARTPQTSALSVRGTGVDYETNTALCPGQHSVSASQSDGTVLSKSISVSVATAHCSILKSGSFYVWAQVPGAGIFVYDDQGNWTPYSGTNVPTAWSGNMPYSKGFTVVNNLNVSGLLGTTIFTGYGLGSDPLSNMIANGTFKSAFTISDKPLPSSAVGTWEIYIPATAGYVLGVYVVTERSSHGTLTIKADGSWTWVKNSETYSGSLHEYILSRSRVGSDKWGRLDDARSSYFLYMTGSDSMSLYDIFSDLYAYNARRIQ